MKQYILFKILSIFIVTILIVSCGDGNLMQQNTVLKGSVTIDNAGIVPIINGLPTTTNIYVHNNGNSVISGISYYAYVALNKDDVSKQLDITSKFFDVSSRRVCANIKAMQSCSLQFTTPALDKLSKSGSVLITLSYTVDSHLKKFSQIINFQKVVSPDSGVYLLSGVNISGFGNYIGYGTVYLYGGGNSNVYTARNLIIGKSSVKVTNGNLINQKIASNLVHAVEISAIINQQMFGTTLKLAFADSKLYSYTTKVSVVVNSAIIGGYLVMGQIPVVDTSRSTSPSGSVLVTNAGDAAVIIGSITATNSGVYNFSGCAGTLGVGQSCTLSFSLTPAGMGSATITIAYTGGSSGSVTQVINWYNSQNGGLIGVSYINSMNYTQSVSTSQVITLTNLGGYSISSIHVYTPYAQTGNATGTISYPTNNSCQNATLAIESSCQFILTAIDYTVEANKEMIFGVTGSYNNGTSQNYSVYGLIYYSTFAPAFLYATNFRGNSISAYSVDPTYGTLTKLSNSPFSSGPGPAGFVVSANNQFMYVANSGSSGITGFSVNSSTGSLSGLSGSPYSSGLEPIGPVLTPNGKFLYVPNWISSNITAYSVNATSGILTKIANYNVTSGQSPQQIVIDATSTYLYTTLTNNQVLEYKINASNGTLSLIGTNTAGNYPYGMIIDNTNKFLYIVNLRSNNIYTFDINQSTGVLSLESISATGNGPSGIIEAPNNQFLYVVNSSGSNVSGYTINATTGALTLINGTFYAGDAPFNFTINDAGTVMYVLSNNDYFVTAFSINQSTGYLTTINTAASGYAPENLLIDKTNGYLYVANASSDTISIYLIDQITGAITQTSLATTGATPNGLILVQ